MSEPRKARASAEGLRAALEGLDAPFQWLQDNYPKAMREMPTHLIRKFDAARAALRDTGPRPDSDPWPDLDGPWRDDQGYWLGGMGTPDTGPRPDSDAVLLANAILGGSSYLPHREAAERILARDTGPRPDRASAEGLLTSIAARMVRLEGGCEKGHRAGQWHMHQDSYHAIGREIAAALRSSESDSGIEALRGLMEAADEEERTESVRRKRYPRLSWEVETDRHAFYEACISYVRAVLSTPPETSE